MEGSTAAAAAGSSELPTMFCSGQPPTMEWMTLKFRALASESESMESVAPDGSMAMDTWQEPPPWTAVPWKWRDCEEPAAMMLDALSRAKVVPRSLQG